MERWPHSWRPIMIVNTLIMLLHYFYNLFLIFNQSVYDLKDVR